MLLNASLVSYHYRIRRRRKIIGVSSPEYIFQRKYRKESKKIKFKTSKRTEIQCRKIIAYQPDVIFTNYVASSENTYEVLKKNGIEIIFIDEYLEEKPLEKQK